MISKEIKEWLAEYKGLSSAEINTFASTLSVNDKLIADLFDMFETAPYCVQELDPVCHQLYEFYRSKEEKLKLFSLQFVASLVWLYLRCLSCSEKKVVGGVETFLLGVYNLETVKPDGTPVVESFCIPSISKASVYHESRIPGVTEPLTEHALRSLSPSQSVWRCGPYAEHERFNAQNRFSILSFIMQRYNFHIDRFHTLALGATCNAAIGLCSAGIASPDSHQPRNTVTPSLLIEYVVALYFALFSGHHSMALKAVEAVHNRASYELYSDVLLVTNAILHSHHRGNLVFVLSEISIGVHKIASQFKNSITNASFKAKKLPDDIEFVEETDNTRLPTVEEDQEQSVAKGLKAKLLTFGGKLGADKNKNRDTVRRDSDTSSLKSNSGFDVVDAVGVAVRNPSGNVVVDMLEMQALRGENSVEISDSSGRLSYGEKSGDGNKTKASSSPTVFSKKSGASRQASHGLSGLAAVSSESPSKPPLSFTSSAPSSVQALSSLSTSLSSNAVNGKSTPGVNSDSSSNSFISNVKGTSLYTKMNPSDDPHSPRAQSEGPIRDGFKIVPNKQPPSSSPSLLVSQSFPASEDLNSHGNLSQPTLTHHSSLPAEVISDGTNTTSVKPGINQESCSTNL